MMYLVPTFQFEEGTFSKTMGINDRGRSQVL